MYNIGLHRATEEEPAILKIEVSTFVKKQNKQGLLHVPILYTGARSFHEALRAVFVVHCIDSASEIVEFLKSSMYHTSTVSVFMSQTFSSSLCLISLT